MSPSGARWAAVKAWEKRFSAEGDFSEAELALIAERQGRR